MSLFNLAQQALGGLIKPENGAPGALTELLSGDGMSNLVNQFQQGGFGSVIASWISNGENQAITAQALSQVLGHEKLAGLADRFGQDPDQLAAQLAEKLPDVVNALTPNGTLDNNGFGLDDVLRVAGSLMNRQS